MIVIDTSALVDSICGSRHLQPRLDEFMSAGENIVLPAAVLYEWLRGPRNQQELFTQELLFPSAKAVPFTHVEAAIAAQLYRSVRSPRSREIDLAIAATAISHGASLWTLNHRDFEDVPALRLI